MPANDGNTAVWYMILDDQEGVFAFEHKTCSNDYK
jgi:hypothetical protein